MALGRWLAALAFAALSFVADPPAWAADEPSSATPILACRVAPGKPVTPDAAKAAAAQAGGPPSPLAAVEQPSPVDPRFVPVCGVSLVVTAQEGPRYRVLDLDAYVACDTPDDAKLLTSQIKVLISGIRKEAGSHDWSEFRDPVTGTDVAKAIVEKVLNSMRQTAPALAAVKIDDVYVQSLVLH